MNELDPTIVDQLVFYQLNYFRPARGEITAEVNYGQSLMREFACIKCRSSNPQNPADHGNIALPLLFRIDMGVE